LSEVLLLNLSIANWEGQDDRNFFRGEHADFVHSFPYGNFPFQLCDSIKNGPTMKNKINLVG